MTTDVVEKCAISAATADGLRWEEIHDPDKSAYRNIALAVIDALADGVSEEMVRAASSESIFRLIGPDDTWDKAMRRALSAAIRAAKSRDDTPPPPKD